MLIRFASLTDVPVIHHLAHRIWPHTYQDILAPGQIEFMLSEMYSEVRLIEQMKNNVTFLLAEAEYGAVAFASYSLIEENDKVFKIHKLYILPEEQGKGLGKQLINFIRSDVVIKGGQHLELNINRHNPVLQFYKNYGFEISREVDIPYYQFTLNDYVMRLAI